MQAELCHQLQARPSLDAEHRRPWYSPQRPGGLARGVRVEKQNAPIGDGQHVGSERQIVRKAVGDGALPTLDGADLGNRGADRPGDPEANPTGPAKRLDDGDIEQLLARLEVRARQVTEFFQLRLRHRRPRSSYG